MKFSEKIVFMRKKRGISQDRLATKMGVSRQTIYKWEADLNTPEFNKIERLAEILDISYDLLLDDNIDLEEYFNNAENPQNNLAGTSTKEEKSSKKSNKLTLIIGISIVTITMIIASIIAYLILDGIIAKIDTDSDKITIIDTSTDTNIEADTDTDTTTDTGTDTDKAPDKDAGMAYIYFDSKGGVLEEKNRKVKINEAIGELPIPTKENFLFSHWENGNGIIVSQYTIIDADVVLYAVYEDVSNMIHLTLNANGGNISVSELDVKKGSNVYLQLPIPAHSEGKKFLGWFDDNGILVLKTSKYYKDTAFTAYWDKLELCPSGGEHSWSMWDYDKAIASCETDGIATKYCRGCLYEEQIVTEKATGHKIEKWNYDTMLRWGECSECGKKETINYTHLKDTCIESTQITGNVYGQEYIYALYDGEFDSFTGPGCAENEEMTVDIKLKESTFVDYIFTHGRGEMSFTIWVMYQNESEFTKISGGYFDNKPQCFSIDGYITRVRIYTDNAEGHWQEIALAQVPKEEK